MSENAGGNKIDEVVGNLVDAIQTKERGFVLGLTPQNEGDLERLAERSRGVAELLDNGPETLSNDDVEGLYALCRDVEHAASNRGTKIIVQEQPKPLPIPDEYEPLAAYRDHDILDTESFIDFVKRYGTLETCQVMVSGEMARFVYEQDIDHGQREFATLQFAPSDDWVAWESLLNKPMPHKSLLRALWCQAHNVVSPNDVMTPMSEWTNASTAQEISSIQEMDQSYSVIFKTGGSERKKDFPKEFEIMLSVLDQDILAESDDARLRMRLRFHPPSDTGQVFRFEMFCPEWKVVFAQRAKKEVDRIKTALGDDWPVFHGTFKTRERVVGRCV